MDKVRVCKDCGRAFPETRDFFGQYKNVRNGIVAIGFRNSCRECMAANTAKHSAAKPEVKQENISGIGPEQRSPVAHTLTWI